ncbi:membrane protein [Christiangramia forsetii KT0803]|uniref:Membrane protein n=3 Tax=Christiangramia forsetii TaxID=411153 RepID=A0M694_CHRFK|nr:membrane protein [Christiangramia forsetii KT0803]
MKMQDLTRRQYMETGILLSVVLLVYGWYGENWNFGLGAAGILLVSLILPILLKPLAIAWFGLAKVLSFITSNILLTILFFLLVTPVGLFRRMLGKDSLKLKSFKKSSNSVLEDRNYTYQASDLKNPF